jgi:UDP-N-acetylmuramoylalanine--D-glutamate ligase
VKTVAIIGGGESGVGAAMLAQKNRYEVFVSDFGLIQDKYKSELNINSIPFEEGGHNFERIEQADIIIKSPGIPDKAPLIQYLIAKDIVIISEIEFASRYYNGKIIGVTGSNGKSTTVSLIYHVLHEAQLNVGLAGNIGYAFSRLLLEEKTYEYAVLELSSFQLDNVYDIRVDIGVLLNITADHLDRYNYDIKEYARAKWRLIERVNEEGLIILNSNDQLSNEFLILRFLRC